MAFLANADINRLAAHSALHQLGHGIAGVFIAAFLLRAGLPPAQVFLALAGSLLARFALRPLVLAVVPVLGARRTLVLGTLLSALQYPALARVQGIGPAIFLWVAVAALGEVFYWTCYHAFFAALGDRDGRGRQVGLRQALLARADIAGPAAGGAMLAAFGPWAAFGAASAVTVAAVLPLRHLAAPPVLRRAPREAYRAARVGALLFVTDGWITVYVVTAWEMAAFRSLASRYDAFGGLLTVAALAGAAGGLVLGRSIDRGQGRRAIAVNAAGFAAIALLKASCAGSPVLVLVAATVSAAFGGFYVPLLMTAVYNAAKASPCALRFHFAAEGGLDCGAAAACLTAAALLSRGLPLPAVIPLALPAILVQALLLRRRYADAPPGGGRAIVAADGVRGVPLV
jgi:MFS transporter, DHA1 family, inner membrane transport protein